VDSRHKGGRKQEGFLRGKGEGIHRRKQKKGIPAFGKMRGKKQTALKVHMARKRGKQTTHER